jgi:hypothetical protein
VHSYTAPQKTFGFEVPQSWPCTEQLVPAAAQGPPASSVSTSEKRVPPLSPAGGHTGSPQVRNHRRGGLASEAEELEPELDEDATPELDEEALPELEDELPPELEPELLPELEEEAPSDEPPPSAP